MNPKKWVGISFGLVGLVSFLILRQFLGGVWDYFRLPLYEEWVVTVPDILAVVLGIGITVGLKKSKAATEFTGEVLIELSKVSFPNRNETLTSTVIVSIMVGIASLLLVLIDTIWGTVTQKFLSF